MSKDDGNMQQGQRGGRRRRGAGNRPPAGGRRAAPPVPRRPVADSEPPPRGYTAAFDEDDDLDFLDDEPAVAADAAPPAAVPPTGDEPRKRRRRRRKRKSVSEPSATPAAPAPEAPPQAAETPATPQRPPRRRDKPPVIKPPAAKPAPAKPPAAEEPAAESAERTPARSPASRPRSAPPAKRPPPEAEKQPPAAAEKQPAAVERKPVRRHAPTSGFFTMGLSQTMLDALAMAEYLEPTPVQAGLIPRALAGVDVMGQARTGTGKTAAFAIPLLEKMEPRGRGAPPQALVLVPTRELAVQVRDECTKLAAGREVHVVGVYGGKPIREQVEHLRRGAELLVGTPGRVIDLLNRGLLMLGDLRWVVLDEADRMLDIGFRPDIEKILRRCPQSRQSLLLSATIAPPVKRLAERYMREPEMLDFSTNDLAVETIEQFYFTVDPERKFDLLVKLLERDQPAQAIVFCRTKRGTDKLYRRLKEHAPYADTIHGDLAQSARDRVMRRFREGKVKLLIATDVVGRGIDVTSISHIINFDIPQFCDDYVHRVGRTGRMGREGVAYSFVSPEEGNELTRIEMRINRLLKRDEIDGFVALAKPQPTSDFDETTGEPVEPPPPKPVYGKPQHRYRRAL